jgi:2-keto-3-deoxy-L-rhamnonate aldolase RhmA
MNPNKVESMLKRGEVPVETLVAVGDPDIAEIIALGFNWLVFEHGPFSIETVETMIRATSGTRIVVKTLYSLQTEHMEQELEHVRRKPTKEEADT